MDNHPIPQDITGFKFRLIGSITLKQFAYLLAAAILTYVILITPTFFVLKIPFVMLFSASGLALAFIPIDGRPMDKMIFNFIRAIPSENQYVYRKVGAPLPDFVLTHQSIQTQRPLKGEQQAKAKRALFFRQLQGAYGNEEIDFLKKIKSFFEEQLITPEPVTHTPVPTQQPMQGNQQNVDSDRQIAEEVKNISRELSQVKQVEQKSGSTEDIEKKIKELEDRLEGALREKEMLEKKLFQEARRKQTENLYKPSSMPSGELPETPRVTTVAPSVSVNAGFPMLPDIPNIVLGVVKDPRGKELPNILVEILDKNDIPVRAFKTNSLGQFIAATPLSDGIYKIIFDDPQKRHDFDAIEITLKGEIFHPLEIISIDQREILRRELFNENGGVN